MDYQRAKMWYERAAELGDREALNGLGILYRDGLGVPVDLTRAQGHFQAAAAASLPEAQVNVAKLLLNRGEYQAALPFLDSALRGGNPLEAFHLSAQIHTTHARSSKSTSLPPAMCGVAVAYEKLVSERGSWNEDFLLEADEAWARGEEGKAMMGWYIAAEKGYEIAQNNVAFMREGGWQFDAEREGEWEIGKGKAEEGDTRALVWWLRSAAQDNVDAMVKVGDYYCSSIYTTSFLSFLFIANNLNRLKARLPPRSSSLPLCIRDPAISNGILESWLDVSIRTRCSKRLASGETIL